MLSQINGSAGRFLVVHTELQVHYPEIAVSPAESGGIRPSGGIRRIPADSAGNWLSYSTVNHPSTKAPFQAVPPRAPNGSPHV